MEVTLKYTDTESLTIEEVVKNAVQNYGRMVKVEIAPDSTLLYDYITFGIQQLISHEQFSLLFERGANYQASVGKLREKVKTSLLEILDQVIIENEAKVS